MRRLLPLLALLVGAACADRELTAPGGGRPPGQTPPPGGGVANPGTPTSFDLIAAAERAGTLSSEQALLERLWAATFDDRLAARFRDPHARTRVDAPSPLGLALREAAERLTSVSAATQRELVPYFQPPAYAGSAWTRPRGAGAAASLGVATQAQPGPTPIPAEGWTYTDHPTLPVRVWRHPEFSKPTRTHYGDEPTGDWNVTEANIFAELQKSWPKLTTLMGRAPLPDGGPHSFDLLDGTPTSWGDGGSPAFDIYLIDPNDLGIRSGGAAVLNYPPTCSARPAFMLLSPWFNKDRQLGPVLAHELFHAIQFAFERQVACDDAWDESTAEWASYYVYPRWSAINSEYPDPLLRWQGAYIGGTIGYHEWLFNAYLQHAHSPDLIRRTYEAYSSVPTAMHALDLGLPGGLKRHMKEFARHAYNQPPAGESFLQWEGEPTKPTVEETPAIVPLELGDGERRREWEVGAPQRWRERYYRRYGVARGGTTASGSQGDTVRYLEFTNPHVGAAKASVQAYVKLQGGDWQLQDWSTRSRIEFCYDTPGERVDSLIVIMSDHRLPDPDKDPAWHRSPLPKGKVEARDACPQDPQEYVIQIRDWTVSEKLGTTYDVSYAARVKETEPGSREFSGSGAYQGTVFRLYPANCSHMEFGDWPKPAVPVSGTLDASIFTAAKEGNQEWMGYALVTLDWTWMPFYDRHAATQEEKEAVAGLGTIGSGMDLHVLVDGNLELTEVTGTSTSHMECAGTVTSRRQISVTRMR